MADQQNVSAARREIVRVEAAAGEAVVEINLEVERLAGELGGGARAHLRRRQAGFQLDPELLQRPARGTRLLLALRGEPALRVAAGTRRLVLRFSMPEQPDHVLRYYRKDESLTPRLHLAWLA